LKLGKLLLFRYLQTLHRLCLFEVLLHNFFVVRLFDNGVTDVIDRNDRSGFAQTEAARLFHFIEVFQPTLGDGFLDALK
jgi:hypothetical protein